jgi:hypothetical protein
MPRHFPLGPDAEHGHHGDERQKHDGHNADRISDGHQRIHRLPGIPRQQQFLEKRAPFHRAQHA